MSVRNLADIIGLFLSSFLSDRIGRKKGSLLQILTSCLFYLCNSFLTLTLMVAASRPSCLMVKIPSYLMLSEVSKSNKDA